MTHTLNIVSWAAVAILATGYWLQVWKIHVHKEVRDISLLYMFFLAIGFGTLAITAAVEGSAIFLVKQVGTFVPCCVIIFQVFYHKEDRWQDRKMPRCPNCKADVERRWKACPYCGEPRKSKG